MLKNALKLIAEGIDFLERTDSPSLKAVGFLLGASVLISGTITLITLMSKGAEIFFKVISWN